jgi:hemolysin activation/secretion protein
VIRNLKQKLTAIWIAFLMGSAVLISGDLLVRPSTAHAQINAERRDQTMQQAAPGRFDLRFRAPNQPKATIIPLEQDTLKPSEPSELKKIKFYLKNIIISGSTIYDKKRFAKLYSNYLNRTITLAHVYRMASAITARYRNSGYILTKAVIPPQEIADGVVRIQIIEGYIDQVNFKGDVRGPKVLLNEYREKLLSSRPLRAEDLERYLLLIDDLPGVTVKSVLTPSATNLGASRLDIILENKNYDASASFDNRGTVFNGPYQFSANATWNSPLKAYGRLGGQGVVTAQSDELKYFSGFYELPVSTEGTRFLVSGSLSSSNPGDTLKIFEVDGTSSSIGFRVSHPFLRSRSENLTGFVGFTGKDSQTDILNSPNSVDRLRVLELGMSYDFADSMRGINQVNATLSQGLNIFNATETGSALLSRERGTSDFTKLSGQFLRLQEIAPSWSLLGAINWQYAFNPLLALEEFGFGGSQYGRAYDSSEIIGDSGIAFKLEIQKSFSIQKPYLRSLQAYTFYDTGSVWLRGRTIDGESQRDLNSLGFGTRFNIDNNFSGFLEFAKPLDKIVASEGDDDVRVFFGLTARY